jgi:hypothetical protein
VIAHTIVADGGSTLSTLVDIAGAVALSVELVACVYVVARGIAWWLEQQKGSR